jgi:hypothetical protein
VGEKNKREMESSYADSKQVIMQLEKDNKDIREELDKCKDDLGHAKKVILKY